MPLYVEHKRYSAEIFRALGIKNGIYLIPIKDLGEPQVVSTEPKSYYSIKRFMRKRKKILMYVVVKDGIKEVKNRWFNSSGLWVRTFPDLIRVSEALPARPQERRAYL